MTTDNRESFVRWQGITRDYFSSVSNLVLGLATGLLAFLISGLTSLKEPSEWLLLVWVAAAIFLAFSIALAVWCAINRLRDFHATAKIARSRWKEQPVSSEDRTDSKVMGQLSWRLFWWQLILFTGGAIGVAITIILQLVA